MDEIDPPVSVQLANIPYVNDTRTPIIRTCNASSNKIPETIGTSQLLKQVYVLMYAPVIACCPLLSLVETLSSLLNLRHIDDAKLFHYHERLSQEQNLANHQYGMHLLYSFVENNGKYKQESEVGKRSTFKKFI